MQTKTRAWGLHVPQRVAENPEDAQKSILSLVEIIKKDSDLRMIMVKNVYFSLRETKKRIKPRQRSPPLSCQTGGMARASRQEMEQIMPKNEIRKRKAPTSPRGTSSRPRCPPLSTKSTQTSRCSKQAASEEENYVLMAADEGERELLWDRKRRTEARGEQSLPPKCRLWTSGGGRREEGRRRPKRAEAA